MPVRPRENDLAAARSGDAFALWCAAHLDISASAPRQARGGGETLDPERLARPHAVLEVQFADGSVFYTDPVDFAARHGEAVPAQRGADAAPALRLPFDLADRRGAAARRGATPTVPVERYTLSELTDPSSLDRLYDFATLLKRSAERWLPGQQPSDAPLAVKLCAAFENGALQSVPDDRGGTLLHWRDGAWRPLEGSGARTLELRGERVLVFLHGTASSTLGSFGPLWAAAEGDAPPAEFAELAARCTLLSWEHRTLTRGPLDNATELIGALLDALPQRAGPIVVDLVSHSRGGLIGELFALCGADGLNAAQQTFEACHAAPRPGAEPHPDAALVAPLFDAARAASARLRPGTFVRVACPARGTLLADGRTDLFLSLLLRALGLALGSVSGGLGVALFDRFSQLVRSLVAARADAKKLPGLEAMIPGSALTVALARCGARPVDRLRVIAGDTRGKGWAGLLTLLGDVFYGLHDHDFVVHTRSMLGGLARTHEAPRSLRLEGREVSHFAYFEPGSLSRGALLAALAGRDDGFGPLADDERRTRALPGGEARGVWQALERDPLSRRPRAAWLEDFARPEHRRKPALLVLPGIMGSELSRAAAGEAPDRVWLALGAMLDGSLEQLALDPADTLAATGLLPASYERLLERARERFRVLACPFDWRREIRASALELRACIAEVERRLADDSQPIHLLVHSMGGLVAREALYGDADGRALWQRLALRGSRLLMLGTPNTGSYAPVQLLVRQYPIARLLAALARKVSDRDMARFGAGFPGLLQMLPQAADPNFGDLFDDAAWRRIAEIDGAVQLPDPRILKQARHYVRGAAFAASLDALKRDPAALYVAGSGVTAVELRRSVTAWDRMHAESGARPNPALEFLASPEGDGTVPWSAALAPERTWYAPCEHGTLPDHDDSFEAYFELLAAGHTRRLPQQPPRVRAHGEPVPRSVLPPPAEPALLPADEAELAAYVLQHGRAEPAADAVPEPIAVHVIHGGIDFARHPLMVGHYQNVALAGAAKRVDEQLDGQLSQLISLGLFVGASRTGHYLRPNNHAAAAPAYPGALMLGLGTVGELTPSQLADTVTRGVLRYAFEHLHRDPFSAPPGQPVDLRLSTVLVGTHVQAVTPRDSLAGVLYGVWRAARLLLLQAGGLGRTVRIRELEILEIEEHVALDAAYELKRLLQRDEWRERLRWDRPVLEQREGALSGYRRRGLTDSVWQRLVVRSNALGGLDFALIGDRARVESTQVHSDVASLRRLIDRLSDNRAEADDRIAGPTDPRFGGVLFQMLLPFDLKGRLANLDNTVLVLDDEAARYPWELLSPPLAGPADGDRPRPFVVHAGMVRQRETTDFRRLPTAITGYNALIVGAPSTARWRDAQGAALEFAPLDGALAEAAAVARQLGEDRLPWVTTQLVGEPVRFEQVRIALLEKDYRLLHLCGHGVVDQWVRSAGSGGESREVLKTGMVLSDQEVLSAADIAQMDPVPEFVFINCCYSGRDGESFRRVGDAGADGAAPVARAHRHPVLAASLALKFIEMGSRAVVAAGWQVDDAAALQFAERLYRALLVDHECFGDAVRLARQAVYEQSQGLHNTWGAYQCYGDPSWRLNAAAAGVDAAGAGSSRLRDAESCMSPQELAGRIGQVVGVAGDRPASVLLAQLDRLIALLEADEHRRDWLRHSRVRAALGEAYRELGDHERAARWLQRGARGAYSQVEIGQLELLVNSLSRAAAPEGPVAAARLLDRLDAVSEDVAAQWPLGAEEIAQTGAAPERECLRGHLRLREAARRLARPPAERSLAAVAQGLAEAARRFADAWRDKQAQHDDADRRAHALANAMFAAALASFASGDPQAALDALAPPPPARRGAPAARASMLPAAPDGRPSFAAADARPPHASAGAPPLPDAEREPLPPAVQPWLGAARALLDELAALDEISSFWHQTNRLELKIASAVLAHTQSLDQPLDALGEALALLDAALVRWPSPNQMDSLLSRLRLVRELALALEAGPGGYDGPYQDLQQLLPVLADEALARLVPRAGGA